MAFQDSAADFCTDHTYVGGAGKNPDYDVWVCWYCNHQCSGRILYVEAAKKTRNRTDEIGGNVHGIYISN